MSLSVLVRASSTSGSRTSSRKYSDLERERSTRPAKCRSVSSASGSGSIHDTQPSSSWVKTTGGLTLFAALMIAISLGAARSVCAAERGAEHAQSGDDAHLERQERNELRERDDSGVRPAGGEQGLHVGCSRIARAEHQQMRMFERRSEPIPEIGLALRADAVDQAGLVLDRKRSGRKGAVGARGLAPRDFDIDRFDQARAIGGRS